MYRVVGFEVETESIDNSNMEISSDNTCKIKTDAKSTEGQRLKFNTDNEITMTYEVIWQKSDIPWASRWDSYLKMTDVQIHWFSIINSLIVVFFLAGILSMIIIRSLRRDIAKYNREEEPEEAIEESGWKLVHGDVFRPPKRIDLFTTLVGSGIQLFTMAFIVIGKSIVQNNFPIISWKKRLEFF